jgi:putative tricarboxylic transport membrane protein
VGTITSSYLWANVAMFAIMLLAARPIARLTRVPWPYLMPVVAAFCVLGSFALANRFFDVWAMLGFGLLGFLFDRWRIPLAPFVIGFVLMPIGEEAMVTALMSSGGYWWPLLSRPGALILIAVAALLLGWSLRQRRKLPSKPDC